MTIHVYARTAEGLVPQELIKELEFFQYPGGEWHLRGVPNFAEAVQWIVRVSGADPVDLVKAALVANMCSTPKQFILMLPYIPAARSDRGVPRGISVYAGFIRAMLPHQIIVIDPHSEVSENLLNTRGQLSVVDTTALVLRAIKLCNTTYDGIIAPDEGAVPRAQAVATALQMPLYTAKKHRDFATGKILSLEAPDLDTSSEHYLVVDDICDGGGTFMLLADKLGIPRKRLDLWVTHGIFSGNAEDLKTFYGQIYTTDSHPGHNRLGVATTILPTFHEMLALVKPVPVFERSS